MKEMSELEKKLLSIAVFSLRYSETLGLNSQKLSSILGVIFRNNNEQVKDFPPQELSLLLVHLYDIDEEHFEEYLNIFGKEMVSHILSNTNCIVDQLNALNAVENFYYDFGYDLNKKENVYDAISKFKFSDFIKKLV